MSMILLAIIGANINASAAYWICYGIYCVGRIIKIIDEVLKEM